MATLKDIKVKLEMAIKCVEKEFTDEALLHANMALVDVARMLAARPAQTEQQPILAVKVEDDCVEHVHPEYGGGYFFTEDAIVEMYAAPIAQTEQQTEQSILLPERIDPLKFGHMDPEQLHALGWNEALDKVARLNDPIAQTDNVNWKVVADEQKAVIEQLQAKLVPPEERAEPADEQTEQNKAHILNI